MREIINPCCIVRPGFLWFKARRHEPDEEIDRITKILHVRVGRTATDGGEVVHLVGVVCRHCRQPYFEVYRWTNSISWSGWEVENPHGAQRQLDEAYDRELKHRGFALYATP